MSEVILENIKNFILNSEDFLITSHVHSDGDSIGSELAIAELLRIYGKNFYIYNNDKYSGYLSFFPKVELIKYVPPANPVRNKNLIVLDSAFSDRIGKRVFESLNHIDRNHIAVIDHHPNEIFNDKCYINPDASSTAELIYDLLEYMEAEITPDMAIYLFTGIFTDTLSFRQTNTTARSLFIASKLFNRLPYSHYRIIELLYENKRFQGLKLLGDMIDNAVLDRENRIIYAYLTHDMYERNNACEEDIEDFINHLRSVQNVKVACIFRETADNEVKVNLRAKAEEINLTPFVRKYSGGGHSKAAGFSVSENNLQKVMEKVLIDLKNYIKNT